MGAGIMSLAPAYQAYGAAHQAGGSAPGSTGALPRRNLLTGQAMRRAPFTRCLQRVPSPTGGVRARVGSPKPLCLDRLRWAELMKRTSGMGLPGQECAAESGLIDGITLRTAARELLKHLGLSSGPRTSTSSRTAPVLDLGTWNGSGGGDRPQLVERTGSYRRNSPSPASPPVRVSSE